MAVRQLPDKPNLEHLRKEAKALLARTRVTNPESKLADVQFALAREYGFASWPRLKRHVEDANPDWEGKLRLFVMAATEDVRDDKPLRMLEEDPSLAEGSFWSALCAGEEETALAELDANPAAATQPGGPRNWEPIQYLCMATASRETDAARARIAARLIELGANANSATPHQEGEKTICLPILYGATGKNDLPALARALLLGGADVNDHESVYHAAQFGHIDCLEVMKEFKLDLSSRRMPFNNTPLYFLTGHRVGDSNLESALRGIRWMLANGVDASVTSYKHRETPLHGWASHKIDDELGDLYIANGAPVSGQRADGKTALAIAVRAGNKAAEAMLLKHGAKPEEATQSDRFFGACATGDESTAREIMKANPRIIQSLSVHDRHVLAGAAGNGNDRAVELMASLGFDINAGDAALATPIHWAAWRGHSSTVRLLIKLGARLDPIDATYKCTPLFWAAHGSRFAGKGDHIGAMQAMLDAGAEINVLNGNGDKAVSIASPEMERFMLEHGALR
ncbi:ankyrin repeat domain-containing protein [soil metagenome]